MCSVIVPVKQFSQTFKVGGEVALINQAATTGENKGYYLQNNRSYTIRKSRQIDEIGLSEASL